MASSADPNPKAAPPERRRRMRALALLGTAVLLLALLAVLVSRVRIEGQKDRECRANLEQLGRAAEKYAAANGGVYPYGHRALEELILRDLHHRKFAVCPLSGVTYRWTDRVKHVDDPAGRLLAWEDPRSQPHGFLSSRWRVLYVRGRVGELKHEELERALAEEKALPREQPKRPAQRRPGLDEPDDAPPPGYLPKLPPGTRVETRPGEK
jgi:hypothetical protein